MFEMCFHCLFPGLSPRVRGNLSDRGRVRKERRSIPACAGERFIPCTAARVIKVYPRACGGTG